MYAKKRPLRIIGSSHKPRANEASILQRKNKQKLLIIAYKFKATWYFNRSTQIN